MYYILDSLYELGGENTIIKKETWNQKPANMTKIELSVHCPKDDTHKISIADSEIDRVTGDELLVFNCPTCNVDINIKMEIDESGLITLTEETCNNAED